MPTPPVLQLKNLTKQFPRTAAPAVADLSLTCAAGELVGVIGENGAGKTTALRMISTMIAPDSGRGFVCGYDLAADSAGVRCSIGILFGGVDGLYERLTAAENIRYFARLNGMSRMEADSRLRELTPLLGLEHFLQRRAGAFSTGMRQRTLIARALIHDPPLILLDEPVTGLDPSASRTVYAFIEGCRREGSSVLFSTHDLAAAERICDRILVLHAGRTIALDTPARLRGSSSGLDEAFLRLTESEPRRGAAG